MVALGLSSLVALGQPSVGLVLVQQLVLEKGGIKILLKDVVLVVYMIVG